MKKLEVTKNFQTFINGIFIENYHEVYDLFQAAKNNERQYTFRVEKCNGSEDKLIIHEASNNALRLSPAALAYFPEWIEQNLMNGLDAESYWGMENAKEKDDWEERTRD